MTFAIDGQFVWDFRTAYDEAHGMHHLFHLHAPASLGDAELRHRNARIGHAVSVDPRGRPRADVGAGLHRTRSVTGVTYYGSSGTYLPVRR